MKKRLFYISILSIFYPLALDAQQAVWSPDAGNGKYRNPIIYADYSDPDVVRVKDTYYMTSSSFSNFPGLPILQSKDLVNWKIIGHAIQNYPYPEFEKPRHGDAVWAPSIRYHKGEFYIYYGDPDRGVFMTKTKCPEGAWTPLVLVKEVKGWIDCCPLWDDNGKVYLVHAYANSRCGIKSKLAVAEMNASGTKAIGSDSLIYDGTIKHPTLEGPKFYKRNGYYYIFAPAGGVKPGWQVVFRSKNVYGPYEDKIVLEQGTTNVNGPHQGGWVSSPDGKDWFIHFQDRYAYGRIVHLQPIQWVNDWPVMGVDVDLNGIGEPVASYTKPFGNDKNIVINLQTTDEFKGKKLGLQWQWESNYQKSWYSLKERAGYLRLYSEPERNMDGNLWSTGRLLMQKFPAEVFTATTKLTIPSKNENVKAGLIVFGKDYFYIALDRGTDSIFIRKVNCIAAYKGKSEIIEVQLPVKADEIYFRIDIGPSNPGEITPVVLGQFSYSVDGVNFAGFGKKFTVKEGHWIGAKIGLFSTTNLPESKKRFADFDYLRIQ